MNKQELIEKYKKASEKLENKIAFYIFEEILEDLGELDISVSVGKLTNIGCATQVGSGNTQTIKYT